MKTSEFLIRLPQSAIVGHLDRCWGKRTTAYIRESVDEITREQFEKDDKFREYFRASMYRRMYDQCAKERYTVLYMGEPEWSQDSPPFYPGTEVKYGWREYVYELTALVIPSPVFQTLDRPW